MNWWTNINKVVVSFIPTLVWKWEGISEYSWGYAVLLLPCSTLENQILCHPIKIFSKILMPNFSWGISNCMSFICSVPGQKSFHNTVSSCTDGRSQWMLLVDNSTVFENLFSKVFLTKYSKLMEISDFSVSVHNHVVKWRYISLLHTVILKTNSYTMVTLENSNGENERVGFRVGFEE